MMTSKQIRRWLVKQPRGESVKVLGEDGETRTIEILAGVVWSQLADTIHALRPETLELLGKEGNLIRSVRPEDQEDDEEGGPEPVVQIPQGVDANTQQLLVFAQLLSGAYRHSTDVAFERMVALFEACNRRSEILEQSLDAMTKLIRRAVQDQYDAAAQAAGGDDSDIGRLIRAFLNGKAEAEIKNSVGAGTNGKTETKA